MYKRLEEKQVVLGRLRVIYMHQRAKYIKQNGDYVRVSSLKSAKPSAMQAKPSAKSPGQAKRKSIKGGVGSSGSSGNNPVVLDDIYLSERSSLQDLPNRALSSIGKKLVSQSRNGLKDSQSLASTASSIRKTIKGEFEAVKESLKQNTEEIIIPDIKGIYNNYHTLSKNGNTFVSGIFNPIVIRNITALNNPLRINMQTENKKMYHSAIHPDGTLMATYNTDNTENTIKLWNISKADENGVINKPIKDLAIGEPSQLTNISFSPDGKTLAADAVETGNILLWNIQPGSQALLQKIVEPDINNTPTYTFSGDSQTIAYISNNTIHFWKKNQTGWEKTDTVIAVDRIISKPITKLALNKDGTQCVCIARNDANLYLWDTESGKHIATLEGTDDDESLYQIVFNPNGKLIAVSSLEGTIYLWYLNSLNKWIKIHTYKKPDKTHKNIQTIMFDSTNKVLLTVENNTITKRNLTPLLTWLENH